MRPEKLTSATSSWKLHYQWDIGHTCFERRVLVSSTMFDRSFQIIFQSDLLPFVISITYSYLSMFRDHASFLQLMQIFFPQDEHLAL